MLMRITVRLYSIYMQRMGNFKFPIPIPTCGNSMHILNCSLSVGHYVPAMLQFAILNAIRNYISNAKSEWCHDLRNTDHTDDEEEDKGKDVDRRTCSILPYFHRKSYAHDITLLSRT